MPKSYDTILSPNEEMAFNIWAKENYPGSSIDEITSDYDLRGAWKEIQKGTIEFDERRHLPDKYKKPNHITFSSESIYADDENPGGTWYSTKEIDQTTRQPKEVWHFQPSPQTIKMFGEGRLKDYFQRNEPDAKLALVPFSPQQTPFFKKVKK